MEFEIVIKSEDNIIIITANDITLTMEYNENYTLKELKEIYLNSLTYME